MSIVGEEMSVILYIVLKKGCVETKFCIFAPIIVKKFKTKLLCQTLHQK